MPSSVYIITLEKAKKERKIADACWIIEKVKNLQKELNTCFTDSRNVGPLTGSTVSSCGMCLRN